MNREEMKAKAKELAAQYLAGILRVDQFVASCNRIFSSPYQVVQVGEYEREEEGSGIFCDIVEGEDNVLHSFRISEEQEMALIDAGAEQF